MSENTSNTTGENLSTRLALSAEEGRSSVLPFAEVADTGQTFHRYELYGISLSSEIPLNFPECGSERRPDVTLFLACADWFAQFTGGILLRGESEAWYQHYPLTDGSDWVRWRGLFEFLVSIDGRSVACRKLERATPESFQTYLLGQVLSFALVKQGYEPLHSTAVFVEGQTLAFLGDCGHGKSTLAAAFLQAGHQILTDDLLLIRDVGGISCGFPGPPRIKLYPEIARRFLPRQADPTPMNPDCDKLIIPLEPDQVCSGPVPMRSFFVLGQSHPARPRVNLTSLEGTEPFIELIRSAFNIRIANPRRSHQQFLSAQQLLSRIPIKRLTFPWNIDLLPEVCQAVLADLGVQ